MTEPIKKYEELPLTLTVSQVGKVLGISRKLAYSLVHQPGFPSVRLVGKRIVIPRDRFLAWIEKQALEPLKND